ncbi:MAG: hypothetical protein R2695_15600 [Acidimicrobiales bacterium]
MRTVARRAATCVSVEVAQDGRGVLDALVWGTDTTDGLVHHTAHGSGGPRARLPAELPRAAGGNGATGAAPPLLGPPGLPPDPLDRRLGEP